MEVFQARRILRAIRTASTSPILVETDDGIRFVKLRGAAQGTGALVAEVIVAELAEPLGLRVPRRCVVTLRDDTPTDDRNDELADLLDFSSGENLGFDWLDGARDLKATEAPTVPLAEATTVLWLDTFVANPDRSTRNTNVIVWRNQHWLIDHGAALGFQYDWRSVREDSPRRVHQFRAPHLFVHAMEYLSLLDDDLASRITRDVIQRAVEQVPDSFLRPMLPPDASRDALSRRRAAYVAYLWKRLKAPRIWATSAA